MNESKNWKKILSILLVVVVIAVLAVVYFKYQTPKEEVLPEGIAQAPALTEEELEETLQQLDEAAKASPLAPEDKAKILKNISNL